MDVVWCVNHNCRLSRVLVTRTRRGSSLRVANNWSLHHHPPSLRPGARVSRHRSLRSLSLRSALTALSLRSPRMVGAVSADGVEGDDLFIPIWHQVQTVGIESPLRYECDELREVHIAPYRRIEGFWRRAYSLDVCVKVLYSLQPPSELPNVRRSRYHAVKSFG